MDNGGTKTNNYQVSVPSLLVVNSYWLAFVIRLCSIITNEIIEIFLLENGMVILIIMIYG